MSEERIAVTLESVTVEETANCFVTLQDDAKRQIRVFIGRREAQSLALGLQGSIPDRPLTYEALLGCLTAAGATVEDVCIHDLRNETFYAAANLRVGAALHPVDMRPSDALNLAVRAGCALHVSEQVFQTLLKAEPPADATQAGETRSVTVTKALEPVALSAAEVSEDLSHLYAEDQSDRTTQPINWDVVSPRDAARLARVKQFYRGGLLQAGMDFYHAAMILQHSPNTDDYLLAHEFCVVAISLGVEQAKWLAAASEDRFLMNVKRPQRFGTQYQINEPNGDWSLYEVGPEVQDSLRSAFNVPALVEAQAHAIEMNEKSK